MEKGRGRWFGWKYSNPDFFNAGLHAADRKDWLPFFRSGSRTETVFKQGQKWKKGEDGREQAVSREKDIKKRRAIIKI